MKLRAYLKILIIIAPLILLAENTDVSRSLEKLHNAARQGDVSAQYALGDSYYHGKEVQKDFSAAIKWFRCAAEQGDKKAQRRIGSCYKYGNGVPKDFVEATKWYLLAAEQGDALAQVDLGNCYFDGKGVPQNYTEATRWYRLAAKKNYSVGQLRLGKCYYEGNGVPQDYTEAVKWYRLAAKKHTAAQRLLGNCYYYGKGVPQDYAEAVRWYRLAADKGEMEAQYYMGFCYYYGKGVQQDYTKAAKWCHLSSNKRHTRAQYYLGRCYYYGQGVPQDYAEAVKWFQLAAERKYASAQNFLGDCYYYAKGTSKDYKQAIKWYRLAAEQKNASAQYSLGFCYYVGNGAPLDYKKAVEWYRRAAEQGSKEAQFRMGICFILGNGVPQDYEKARGWYRLAANQGHEKAAEFLTKCTIVGETNAPYSAHEIIRNSSVERIQIPRFFPDDFKIAQEKAFSGATLDQDAYFSLYTKYIQDIYSSFKDRGCVVRSCSSKNKVNSFRNNYTLAVEDIFKTTSHSPLMPKKGATVKTKDGKTVAVNKIITSKPNEVFIKDEAEERWISISELHPSSQPFARALVGNQQFKLKLKISSDKIKKLKEDDYGTPTFHGARESFFYKTTPFEIVIENRSGTAIDDLILEYQVFFKQTVAGTEMGSNDDYRFAGYSIIKNIPEQEKIKIEVHPPPITETKLHSAEIGSTTYYLQYPTGYHQTSSGHMRGIWVRVHRITPYGHQMKEFKQTVYPSKTEWGAIEMLHNQ